MTKEKIAELRKAATDGFYTCKCGGVLDDVVTEENIAALLDRIVELEGAQANWRKLEAELHSINRLRLDQVAEHDASREAAEAEVAALKERVAKAEAKQSLQWNITQDVTTELSAALAERDGFKAKLEAVREWADKLAAAPSLKLLAIDLLAILDAKGEPSQPAECPACRGSGATGQMYVDWQGEAADVTCPECGGTGKPAKGEGESA